jgi:hypothetical protein
MSTRPFLGQPVPSRALHRIAAFSAPPKKGITGHQLESSRWQTHWPVFAAGILRRWCRLSRTGCCGARECGASRNFGLEVRASMLALRIVNYSSHGACVVAGHLEDFQQGQLIHGARTASLASDGKLNCAHPPVTGAFVDAVDMSSAGLSQEITKNIWFWHHQPPSVPLGHNYSNPSHLGST